MQDDEMKKSLIISSLVGFIVAIWFYIDYKDDLWTFINIILSLVVGFLVFLISIFFGPYSPKLGEDGEGTIIQILYGGGPILILALIFFGLKSCFH